VAASVWVSPAEDRRIRKSGFASRDGVARLYLAPENYVVADAWVIGYSYQPDERKSFHVEAGKTARAPLAVQAVPQVAGIVRDPTGNAVSRAKIQVLPLTGRGRDLCAGDDGRFAVDSADVGPFFCFIWVRHPQQNLTTIETVGNEATPLEITLRPPAKVSGCVLDSQGRPVAEARVQAQIDGSHLGRFATVATARTDKDGRYQIELTGTSINYAITAVAPGYGPTETLMPQDKLVQGMAKVEDLMLRAADRKIRGAVQDPRGRPLPGVIVFAESGGQGFLASAVTDEKGQFTMEHLTDDPAISLFATAPGYGWIGDRTIQPGEKEVFIKVGPSHYD
jgi:hypothetical protein